MNGRPRELLLKGFLGLLWLVCLFRAITQSVVHDEALTWAFYIAAPAGQILHYFSPNHHFLNTVLMKLSVSLLGLSEWSMRLPALLGAALYFAAVYRICVREVKSNFACAAAAALLTLNPFVLDFMVAARGYGMAVACLMWALAVLLAFLRDPAKTTPRELVQSGVTISLSVMANLVFIVPALALMGIVWVLLKKAQPAPMIPASDPAAGKKKHQKRKRKAAPSETERALQAFWRWVALPAVCGWALLFLASPLSDAKSGDLYAGAHSIAESLGSLYDASLAYGGVLQTAAMTAGWRDAVTFGVVPLVLLGSLAIGIQRRNLLLILASGTAVSSAAALLVLHLAVNLLYPLDRTGIYFLPLLALALAGLADDPSVKAVRIGAFAFAALFAVQFLLEFNTRRFLIWDYDADTRNILAELSRVVPNHQPGAIRIGNSWQLEPSLNFYATRNNLTWLQPIGRELAPGDDYYVLMAGDWNRVDHRRLKAIYTGKISGTVLAVPQP